MPQDSALPWSNHTEWLPVSLRSRLELGVVAHTCDPRTQEAEAGEMSTQGWSWLHSNSLLKKRKKKIELERAGWGSTLKAWNHWRMLALPGARGEG